jgi:site-specific DNA recombinase
MAVGDELFEAEHPPIIERSVFQRTQELIKAATKDRKIAPRNPEYLLRGLLRCSGCRAGFTTASTTTRGILHRYYRCISRDRRGKEACPSAPMPAQAIEDFVVNALREAVARSGLATELTAAVRERVAARRDALGIERKELPRLSAGLSGELQRGAASLENLTGPARRAIETQLEEVGRQLARHEARLAAVERELAQLDAREVEAAWVANCLTDFHRIWNLLTPENRARLVRAVIERVEINEPANEIRIFVADFTRDEPAAEVAPELVGGGEGP